MLNAVRYELDVMFVDLVLVPTTNNQRISRLKTNFREKRKETKLIYNRFEFCLRFVIVQSIEICLRAIVSIA